MITGRRRPRRNRRLLYLTAPHPGGWELVGPLLIAGLGSGVVMRSANLELWTRPQPAGIRADDAIAWACEILHRYLVTGVTPNNAQDND